MVESKTEMKVSSKSMEAAMVARLFKDAIESSDPIVGHFVWIRDDGQKLDMGRPVVHPSFPNKDSALRRLETRIGQWVSGDKPGLDRNAIARVEIAGAQPFDFSMESFEKAALGDDGTLVIAVGFTKGVGREPMELGRVARLRLYAKNGEPVGRRQALLPIREIIQIQKRERALQAERLESQERQMEDSVDMGLQLSQEEDSQWAEASREPKPAQPAPWDVPRAEREASREAKEHPRVFSPTQGLSQGMSPAPFSLAGLKSKPDPRESPPPNSEARARMMMDMALGAVDKNMGSVLKSRPIPFAQADPGQAGPATLASGDDFDSAFGDDDGAPFPAGHKPESDPSPLGKAPVQSKAPDAVLEAPARFELAVSSPSAPVPEAKVEAKVEGTVEAPKADSAGSAPEERAALVQPPSPAPSDFEHPAPSPGHSPLASQVWAEAPAPAVDPLFLRAVFPDLPEGCDEISVTIQKGMLFAALEALESYGCLELRLASKGPDLLALGLCIPTGKLPTLTEFLTVFSKGGVMIKRAAPPVSEPA